MATKLEILQAFRDALAPLLDDSSRAWVYPNEYASVAPKVDRVFEPFLVVRQNYDGMGATVADIRGQYTKQAFTLEAMIFLNDGELLSPSAKDAAAELVHQSYEPQIPALILSNATLRKAYAGRNESPRPQGGGELMIEYSGIQWEQKPYYGTFVTLPVGTWRL